MSRRPGGRNGNGRTGSSPGRGYVAGSRPPNPPRPTSGATSATSCLLTLVLLPLYLLAALLRSPL